MKRRSNTTPPDEPVFFLDRNLGRHVLPDKLRAAGFKVEVFHDHFDDQALPDPKWIEFCGRKGWAAITPDADCEYRHWPAISSASLAIVILSDNNAGAETWSAAIVSAKAKICRAVRKRPKPFVARLSQDGSIAYRVHEIEMAAAAAV